MNQPPSAPRIHRCGAVMRPIHWDHPPPHQHKPSGWQCPVCTGEAPRFVPRTTTLVLTPVQLATVQGALHYTRTLAERWDPDTLDLGLRVLNGGREGRAVGESDWSVLDRLLMLLDTALAQDGPEVESDGSTAAPGTPDASLGT